MDKFECDGCDKGFEYPILHEGEEVCPHCKSEFYHWTLEGMKNADYWEKAYWNLKHKHNKLIRDLKNAISVK